MARASTSAAVPPLCLSASLPVWVCGYVCVDVCVCVCVCVGARTYVCRVPT
jgi:hypothetical protein